VTKSLLEKSIEKKIGGYNQPFNTVDQTRPATLKQKKTVAVAGAGLAGMIAATTLAERGFEVQVFERENFIGGKVGSWSHTFDDGTQTNIEHGFHAFFRQYYNLRNWLKKIDSYKHLIPISDYLIMAGEQGEFSFRDVATAPILNLLSLTKSGVYRFTDVMTNPKFMHMMALLRYDRAGTFSKFDKMSFQDFSEMVGLPRAMQLMFTTFSRAFFAEPQHISMGELIKSFHFYFLSNDHGLLYDVLDNDFEKTLWQPARSFLERHGGKIHLSTPVLTLNKTDHGFDVNGTEFDYFILATDIAATKKIIGASSDLQKKHAGFTAQIGRQKISQRYAVLRIWIDKDIRPGLPFFIFTDAKKILDSVTIYHQMEKDSAEWVKQNGGGIFELHSYALPDDVTDDSEIREWFLREFEEYFPEIKGATVKYEYLQHRQDFTAFHTGMFPDRPEYRTEVPGLFLAADWVKIPTPAMLMEASASSALFAANEILAENNLRAEEIRTVPLKGIFA
jgi:isorenieratene synthase